MRWAHKDRQSAVFKRTIPALERTVALKFLAARLLQDEEGRARFIREAKVAASLKASVSGCKWGPPAHEASGSPTPLPQGEGCGVTGNSAYPPRPLSDPDEGL